MDGNITNPQNDKSTRAFGIDDAAMIGLSALMSYGLNRYSAKQAEKRQQEMNEYNSPAEQMRRYKAAGLNTALLYGQIESGNQSQPVETPDYGRGSAETMQTALTRAAQGLEMKKIKNDTERVDMERKLNDVNVALTGVQIEVTKEQKEQIARQSIKLDEETNEIRQRISQNAIKFDKELRALDDKHLIDQWDISCKWMDYEQKKFTFEKLMPLQEKYLNGQATYEQVVGELAHELVNAEIFSKRKADIQSWLVSTFGADFEGLIRDVIADIFPKDKGKQETAWQTVKGTVKGFFGRVKQGIANNWSISRQEAYRTDPVFRKQVDESVRLERERKRARKEGRKPRL